MASKKYCLYGMDCIPSELMSLVLSYAFNLLDEGDRINIMTLFYQQANRRELELVIARHTDTIKSKLFLVSCQLGDLKTCIWIKCRYTMPLSVFQKGFIRACELGHLHIAMWINHEAHQSKKREASSLDYLEGFTKSCNHGHLLMVKWIVKAFALTKDVIRTKRNYALRCACFNGHLHVSQWLVKQFDLCANDVQSKQDFALRWASTNGHLLITEWITTFPHKRESNIKTAFEGACAYGHLILAQWLLKHFGLEADDFYQDYEGNIAVRAFFRACNNGHLLVAKWLIKIFDFSIEDPVFTDELHLYFEDQENPAILEWIKEEFDLN